MTIHHTLSRTIVGRYSTLCKGGLHVQIETPAECFVLMPEGLGEFSDGVGLDGNRVGLCAQCSVAARARKNNAVPTLPEHHAA